MNVLKSEDAEGCISSSAPVDIKPLLVKLVRALDAWVTSDRWPDYIESRIMKRHAAWKTIVLCNGELAEDTVRNANANVSQLI